MLNVLIPQAAHMPTELGCCSLSSIEIRLVLRETLFKCVSCQTNVCVQQAIVMPFKVPVQDLIIYCDSWMEDEAITLY